MRSLQGKTKLIKSNKEARPSKTSLILKLINDTKLSLNTETGKRNSIKLNSFLYTSGAVKIIKIKVEKVIVKSSPNFLTAVLKINIKRKKSKEIAK